MLTHLAHITRPTHRRQLWRGVRLLKSTGSLPPSTLAGRRLPRTCATWLQKRAPRLLSTRLPESALGYSSARGGSAVAASPTLPNPPPPYTSLAEKGCEPFCQFKQEERCCICL